MAFALLVIPVCLYIGERYPTNRLILALQKTGQLTLSNYVIHITLGMLLLSQLTGKQYTGLLVVQKPISPAYILAYSIAFYIVSIIFSNLWRRRFKNGPLEAFMRKISG